MRILGTQTLKDFYSLVGLANPKFLILNVNKMLCHKNSFQHIVIKNQQDNRETIFVLEIMVIMLAII